MEPDSYTVWYLKISLQQSKPEIKYRIMSKLAYSTYSCIDTIDRVSTKISFNKRGFSLVVVLIIVCDWLTLWIKMKT